MTNCGAPRRAGELSNPQQLERQVKRMLADPKARRLATEFFGQWLGFYHFDQYRGVDTTRFPEFTDEVKSAMYDEAVSFFEYIVRKDRPVSEILHGRLHVPEQAAGEVLRRDEGSQVRTTSLNWWKARDAFNRGGLLRLGAVLTATSAPLRTSPVKRGDWVLRRILGTPTPPPPADAGTLPADDKMFGGLTVCERWKRTSATRRAPTATCASIRSASRSRASIRSAGGATSTPTASRFMTRARLADKTEIAGVDGLLEYLQDAGAAGAEDAVEEDAGIRARPDGAGVRSAADRTADGGGRRRDVLEARDRDRDQPAVPQPARDRTNASFTGAFVKHRLAQRRNEQHWQKRIEVRWRVRCRP